MNKELIKNFREEFDYFLNEGKVILGARDFQRNVITWYPSVENPFLEESTSRELIVIKDDIYVKFRKAIAGGKTVQYSPDNCETWSDLDSNAKINFRWPLQNYRIKPDEHKFKEGDWVIFNDLVGFVYTICKDTLKICVHGNPAISGWYTADKLTPWKPKVGEYCWFWNDGQPIPNLREFESFRGRYQVKDIGLLSDFYGYAYCEPFINDLPTKLKVK